MAKELKKVTKKAKTTKVAKTVKAAKTSKAAKPTKTAKATKATKTTKTVKVTKTTKKELSAKDRKKVTGGKREARNVPSFIYGSVGMGKTTLSVEELMEQYMNQGCSKSKARALVEQNGVKVGRGFAKSVSEFYGAE